MRGDVVAAIAKVAAGVEATRKQDLMFGDVPNVHVLNSAAKGAHLPRRLWTAVRQAELMSSRSPQNAMASCARPLVYFPSGMPSNRSRSDCSQVTPYDTQRCDQKHHHHHHQ